MALVTDFAFWLPVLAVALAAVLLAGGFKARAAMLVLLVTVGITDCGVVNGLKHWANRPRPHQVEAARVVKLARTHPKLLSAFAAPVVLTSKPEAGTIAGRSFPSAHTANNFAAAAVLALFFRWGWSYFIVAALIGYSRVYTGAHWPSDVLVSVFLGTGMGLLVTAALDALWRRHGARLAPAFHLSHPSLLHQNRKV